MKKILIVEDELAYVKLLRDRLDGAYEVIDAQNGQIGLRKALGEKPDLILLDIKMPVMDGLTVLRELRKDSYGKSAKVILLTNLEANDEIVVKVTEDLPTYYFVKSDIKFNELMDKIDDLLKDSEN